MKSSSARISERGHVFTDRMLNRRGREETLVLGAQTVRPMVERLLPGAHVLTRPRLSQLSFAGEKKITRLPRRSAIVAFSVEEVYAIAELIRRQRGGAAVVLGALSPRTRNAQVDLYQSGDVEYLVATDAIGMGLNLDVDHVAFASDRKFDGYQFRKLNPAELAQIAGRAGRATRDGTFGTTGRCPPFETELVQALESHSFEPIKMLQWRNTALDFSSVGALQASLAETPKENGLTRAPLAEDILVLEHAARDDDIRALAQTRAAVERLWDVCQVPDYRKISPATHAELATTLYGFLMREGTIATDWFALQVEQANHTDGDIDTLSNRIAHIRTWTFAANRPDWLADPEHWQGVTRAVEDRLSDALHERLTERFVDRRTSVLMRRLRENTVLETDISKSGEVVVEGHAIGRLDGFRFTPDASTAGSEAKALAGAAQKALAGEIDVRATRLAQAADGQFVLATDGTIRWLGQPVGKLVAGEEALKPRVRIIADEHLTGAPRDSVQARLDLWLKSHIERILEALFRLAAADDITGIARGVAFQLAEALGVLDRQKVAEEVKGLDQSSRATLRKYGVRFGAYHIYVPALLKPAPRVLATQLWALKHGGSETKGFDAIQQLAASGRTSIAADPEIAKVLYLTAGYRVCGERAVRVDILERLADLIRPALAWRAGGVGIKPQGAIDGFGFTVTVGMTSLAGCSGEAFASVLRSLGYRMEKRPKPAEAVPTSAPSVSADLPGPVAPAAAETVAPVSVPADGDAEPEAAPAPAVDAEPTSNVPVDIEEPAADAAALETIPEAPAPGEPLERASDPAPVEAAEALVSVPEGPTIALTGQTEQIGEVTEAPGQFGAGASTRGCLQDGLEDGLGAHGVHRGLAAGTARRPCAQTASRKRAAAASAAATAAHAATCGGVRWSSRCGRCRGHAAAGGRRCRRPSPDQRRDGGRHRARPAGAERPERQERQPRPDQRPDRRVRAERPGGPEQERGQRGGGRPPPRGDRPDRDPTLRAKYIKGRGEGRDRRDREPDPNSPFAKLAALKEQLEANAKEPR